MKNICWCETQEQIDKAIKFDYLPITDIRIISSFYKNHIKITLFIFINDIITNVNCIRDPDWLIHFSMVDLILTKELWK